jgi:hypothetical protein
MFDLCYNAAINEAPAVLRTPRGVVNINQRLRRIDTDVAQDTTTLSTPQDLKKCSTCQERFPRTAFNKNRNTKDGLQNQCRECSKDSRGKYLKTRRAYRQKLNRERYASEEGYRKHLDRYFRYTYKISLVEYEALVTEQGGLCAICANPPDEGKRLSVDHCHDSEQVRGLLCGNCNTGLGHFRDSPQLLNKAIHYLYEKK